MHAFSNHSVERNNSSSGIIAASALTASALISEGVQIAGTAVLFVLLQHWTGTSNPVSAINVLIDCLRELGSAGYAVFASCMIFLQVVPIAAAFVLTVSAGAIFGAFKGTCIVLMCSTVSASISFLLSRTFGRTLLLEAVRESPQYLAIDAALARASFGTALTLITLLRLSPVLPFAWANYVFGLSGVPWLAFSLGTLLGCLPAVAAYVSTGQLGAEIVVSGSKTSPLLLFVGILASVGGVAMLGQIAQRALARHGLKADLST